LCMSAVGGAFYGDGSGGGFLRFFGHGDWSWCSGE
jgi:hypothetical protein